MNAKLKLDISSQPDDTTCGPTCLHSVYAYFNDNISLNKIISGVQCLDEGGTLAVFLGCHALKRNYSAKIYTYNLQIFDPTWFNHKRVNLQKKLIEQGKVKNNDKLNVATGGYIEFLNNGGEICFRDLSSHLIKKYLTKSIPIITGLSSTYLYNTSREDPNSMKYDDTGGYPTGHFVVICGYDKLKGKVLVADPYRKNPMSGDQYYYVNVNRMIHSILLGILTYDANLLIIEPRVKI